MSFLSIKDAPLKTSIVGDEKIPTGGYGDLTVTVQQIKDFTSLAFSNVDNTSDLDKPVSTATQAALDLKANITYVDTSLVSKADKTYLDDQLALKASKIYVDTELQKTASKTYVDNQLATKASTTYVDSINAQKANVSYVDSELALKSDITYVDTALANKTHNSLVGRDVANAHPASAILDTSGKTQQEINDEYVSVKKYGAVGDGLLHPVSDWTVIGSNIYYPNLAAIQVDYPHVTSLTDSIDWAATQKAINDLPLATENAGILSPKSSPNGGCVHISHGRYVFNKKLTMKRGVHLTGESRESTQFLFSTNDGGIEYFDAGRDVPDEIAISDLAIFQDQAVTPTSGAAITCVDGTATIQAVGLNVNNVLIDGFYHGVLLSAAITSSIRNTNITNSVNHGVYVKFSTGYTLSTSILFDAVYSSLSKNGSGFRIEGAAYSFLNACASDSNARYGYELFQTNTCGLNAGAEYNTLGGVHSTQCRSPRIFVNIVANAANLSCDAVTLDQTAGAVIGGVHSSGADQGGMSIRAIASGVHGTVELGLIRTGGWNNAAQKSNAAHSVAFGGILNGFTGGTSRQWAFGSAGTLNNIQLHNTGNADSTVEHGFMSDVAIAKANASSNAAIIAKAQTQNTAVTYTVLSGFYSQAPVKGAASTVNRYYGTMIDESAIGGTANVNLMVGGLFAPAGNWNIYSASNRASYFAGAITWKPSATATPANNGDMTFELTSDTRLKIKAKGSDAVVRENSMSLLSTTVTYDPPSLVTATQQSTTVDLTGAAVGDIALCSFSLPLNGTRMWAEVTATNTVTVYHRNDTGTTVDLASGTLKVKLI